MKTGSFLQRQKSYFEQSDAKRFAWQMDNPYVARCERQVLKMLDREISAARRILEVGCGQGSNLLLSQLPKGVECWMLDQSWERTAFAAGRTGGRGVCGDAQKLPFQNESFDLVLVRDVLHHVEHPAAVVQEAQRVLVPGGKLLSIEPNGRNLFIRIFSFIQPEERRSRDLFPETVERLIKASGFRDIQLEMEHAFPLWRVVFHYKFGLPVLARIPLMQSAFDGLERWGQKRLTRNRWSYTLVRATKTASA
ncbi:MAG: class I SAM-dependent methyltransferase [Candidatus Omnitrophica bacterium]|nr:class I SAM-dependent methyltransferase [Candidatus Omnitrophota bacterium]